MTPAPPGVTVSITNRQRRLKIDTKLLAKIAGKAFEIIGVTHSQLGIVLVSDAAMAKLNSQYHDTPGPTDILSFDYGKGVGELIISIDHAVSQAKRFHTIPARELVLYLVHGILHLQGYDDQSASDRRRMRLAERRLLTKLTQGFSFGKLLVR